MANLRIGGLFHNKGGVTHENDIPAQEKAARKSSWFPFTHEHKRRQEGACSQTCERKKAALGLKIMPG